MPEPITMVTVKGVFEARAAAFGASAEVVDGEKLSAASELRRMCPVGGPIKSFPGVLKVDATTLGETVLARNNRTGQELSRALARAGHDDLPWRGTDRGVEAETHRPYQFDAERRTELKPPDTDESFTVINEERISRFHESTREEINDTSPYSPEINSNIRSVDELEIYTNAELREEKVNGRDCLVRDDIDINQKDDFGRTNLDRIKQGLSPLDKNGTPIELHHIGQHPESPFAELNREEHRGKGNFTTLHTFNESTINQEDFTKQRAEHWQVRSDELESNNGKA